MKDWISVNDRLPEDDERILISIDSGVQMGSGTSICPQVLMGWYCCENSDFDGLWYSHFIAVGDSTPLTDGVLAWMPLPEPYEEGEK